MASNMKAVKLRIKSVQSTMQITKAMELVASSKLRKAKERAEVCRPYFTELHETLKEIARENTDFSSVYAKESSNNKTCYVVTEDLQVVITPIFLNVWRLLLKVRTTWFCRLERKQ